LTRACPAALGHLWQATVFGVLVGGLAVSLRSAPARLRHSLFLLASLKFLLPSILLLAILGRIYDRLPTPLPTWLVAALDPHAIFALFDSWLPTQGPVSASEVPQGGWFWSLLVIGWSAGAVARTVVWVRRLAGFRALVERGRVVPRGSLFEQLETLRHRLGIRQTVTLVLTEEVVEPGVWGVRRPTVVLPASMPEELDREELEAVLLHELVHVRRRDNLISHLHMALCCLFWFHPVVWWLDRRLLIERERACDDQVVQLFGAPDVYARSLVKVLRLGLGWRLAGVSGAGGADLKGRLEHIRAGEPGGVALWHRGAVAAALGLLVLISLAAVPFCPAPGEGAPLLAVSVQELAAQAEASEEGDEIHPCYLPDAPPEQPDCPHPHTGTYAGGGVRTAI
jgi:Zn-dependent protease with chaperone function